MRVRIERLLASAFLGLVVTLALAGILSAGVPPAARAADIGNVSTTDDELNVDGDCSLREAIQSANTDTAVDACAAGSGADVITLGAGTYVLALAGSDENANATGDLDVTEALTIIGAGPIRPSLTPTTSIVSSTSVPVRARS